MHVTGMLSFPEVLTKLPSASAGNKLHYTDINYYAALTYSKEILDKTDIYYRKPREEEGDTIVLSSLVKPVRFSSFLGRETGRMVDTSLEWGS